MPRQEVWTLYCRQWASWKVLRWVSDTVRAPFQRDHLEGSVKDRCSDIGHHWQHGGAQEEKQAWEGHMGVSFGNLEVDT